MTAAQRELPAVSKRCIIDKLISVQRFDAVISLRVQMASDPHSCLIEKDRAPAAAAAAGYMCRSLTAPFSFQARRAAPSLRLACGWRSGRHAGRVNPAQERRWTAQSARPSDRLVICVWHASGLLEDESFPFVPLPSLRVEPAVESAPAHAVGLYYGLGSCYGLSESDCVCILHTGSGPYASDAPASGPLPPTAESRHLHAAREERDDILIPII